MNYSRIKSKAKEVEEGYSIKFARIIGGITQESKVEFIIDPKDRRLDMEKEIVWRGIKLLEDQLQKI